MAVKRHFLSILATTAMTLGLAVPALAVPAILSGQQPGSRVNVRAQPTTAAGTPNYGLVGDQVEVLDSAQGYSDNYTWYYVKFRSGATGWVRGDFVTFVSGQGGSSPSNRVGYLHTADPGSRVNVRSAPSTNANSPHYGIDGDRVQVFDSTRGGDGYTWYYIKFRSGATGWVRGDFIDLTN
ncbi:MAG TPA: SH3 domain-containing protein [Microcoleaceae cyanobacterium]|jgi:serine/threonine-protein kinase